MKITNNEVVTLEDFDRKYFPEYYRKKQQEKDFAESEEMARNDYRASNLDKWMVEKKENKCDLK